MSVAYTRTGQKYFSPVTVMGFLIPIGVTILIGVIIRAHSRPIQAPLTQTTDSSGSVTAVAPANPPTSAEIIAANTAILAYCQNDLRQDTTCALVPNSNITAPGFVESGLQLSGHFATDGSSSQGLALAKGNGSTWVVVWVGQNCIPTDVATQNSVPSSLNVCSP